MARNALAQHYSDRAIRLAILFNELVILVAIMFLLGYIHWHFTPWNVKPGYLRLMVITGLSYAICNLQTGALLHHRFVRSDHIFRRVLYNQSYFILLTLFIFWSLHGIVFFPAYLIPLYVLTTLAVLAHRWLFRQVIRYVRTRGSNLSRVAFLGNPLDAQRLCEHMMLRGEGFHFVGYFFDHPVEELPWQIHYLGTYDDVLPYLREHPRRINEIYDATPTSCDDFAKEVVEYCDNHLIRVYSIPLVHSYLQRRTLVEEVNGSLILSPRYEPLSRIESRMFKRTFDVLFSLFILLTIFPVVYLVVAIVNKCTSPGPVLFRQRRTGLNGQEFWLYKFRSMHVNAQCDTEPATRHDPRVTRFGRFIRHYSIDELPQFINVLFGDMSVVGPRPHMPVQTEAFSDAVSKYMVRHFILPGITGWAQVRGFRGEITLPEQIEGRVERDILYIEHWSFSLDLYIIILTVFNMLRGEQNAY